MDSEYSTSNFGGQDELCVKLGYFSIRESYFFFPFTNKPNNLIKAEIQFYIWSYDSDWWFAHCNICIIEDTTWGELTMNWINKPSHGEKIANLTVNKRFWYDDGYYKIDITNYITSRNNISLCVYGADVSYTHSFIIYSRELSPNKVPDYGDYPKLIWTYTDDDDDDDDDDKEEDTLEALMKEIPGYNIVIFIGSICGLAMILTRRIKTNKQ